LIKLERGSTSDVLRDDLYIVIKLILVTYIMNHAFTVQEDLRATVIQQLSCYNDPSLYTDMLILKIANSQLKYGFSKIRSDMHLMLLNRLQAILKHAKHKDWWLSAFVIMLGLALTLEEYEHLLHIQADLRSARAMDGNTAHFRREAQMHCADIDEGFEFLTKLFHLRYSTRTQNTAVFPLEKGTAHRAETEFVNKLGYLFAQNRKTGLTLWGLGIMTDSYV